MNSDVYNHKCEHINTVLVVQTYSDGSKHYGKQCLHCGAVVEKIKKTAVPFDCKVVEYDESIREHYNEEMNRYWQLHRRQKDEEDRLKDEKWWDDYNEYLTTPRWASKRKRVLDRDDHVCQACLRREATQAHHLTYEHVGDEPLLADEPLFDLVAVCEVCHDELTRKSRERRNY